MRDHELEDLLTLSRWDQLAPSAQEEAASSVAARLPESFDFAGLQDHELGQQRHRIAFFTWKKARFALIPGGPATLGYNPGKPFVPTPAHLDSWEETCREYPELAREYPTLEGYLGPRLTPLRQVTVQPFLLETRSTDLAPPRVEHGLQVYTFPGSEVSYPQTLERIAQESFRFPTSDEWEYACAAGARTLWRWGDDCPMIEIPRRTIAAEWNLHLRPNAFGLLIGDDPYRVEFTAELGVLLGGDGGTALSAEAGRLVEWLTLASSYWGLRQRVPKPVSPGGFLRRAYSLFN